jgi:sulfate adenylyltransferase subunit 2
VRRSAFLVSVTRSVSGTHAISGPSYGTSNNARVHAGEHVRVFPISNWTELDVWQYIERERLSVPSLYLAHGDRWSGAAGHSCRVTALTPPRRDEEVEQPVRALSTR